MARINVDNEFWSDPRLHVLTELIGKYEAIGAVVCLWDLGQKHWAKGAHLIPLKTWKHVKFHAELVETGFAEIREDGVYCCGATDRWEYLLRAIEWGKAGGQASAAARIAKYGTAIPDHASNRKPEELAEGSPNPPFGKKPNAPKPSSSSSSSYSYALAKKSSSHSPDLSSASTKKEKNTSLSLGASTSLRESDAPKQGSRVFIGRMVEVYQARYHSRPILDGPTQGAIKRLLTTFPIDAAINLYETYLQIEDSWFVKKHHDFQTFMSNLQTISVSMNNGKQPNGFDWAKFWRENDADGIRDAGNQIKINMG